ncbi:hypothetical protein WJX72_000695 [[Myrmecia] bisecta]|uniref:FACT complex subunit SSRP1 n=1 Tax=[Myrmecia] bisecta TaxID=41462 RepID=A0AAW1PIB5_9CHLO
MGHLETLQGVIGKLQSGPKLIDLIKGTGPQQGDIAAAVISVLKESAELRADKENQRSAQVHSSTHALLGQALSRVDALMFITPRGKQDLLFYADRMVLHSAKTDVSVPYSAVKSIAVIDKIPKDTKKKVLLYLHIDTDAGIKNGKQPLSAVVLQTTADAQLDIAHPKDSKARLKGNAPIVICQALGVLGMTSFCSPSRDVFQSSTGDAGIEAVVKVNQGVLFPMQTAICFLERPPLFLPMADIQSVEFGRAGGGSSTFDFFVHGRDGKVQEFSNIPRAEVQRLMQYVADCKLKVGSGEDEEDEALEYHGPAGGAGRGTVAAADDDESDEEDSDFDPDRGSSDEEPAPAKRRKRDGGASGSNAGDAAEEEELRNEEDEEEEGEEEGSGSDEDSDDGSGSEVEVESEDDVPSSAIRALVDQAKQHKKRKRAS